MRGRMMLKALKARLQPPPLPGAPVMPSSGATSRLSLSFAPCFFLSLS
jgi:hypothetical protein